MSSIKKKINECIEKPRNIRDELKKKNVLFNNRMGSGEGEREKTEINSNVPVTRIRYDKVCVSIDKKIMFKKAYRSVGAGRHSATKTRVVGGPCRGGSH